LSEATSEDRIAPLAAVRDFAPLNPGYGRITTSLPCDFRNYGNPVSFGTANRRSPARDRAEAAD
jgi:hypothetical protein